MRRGDDQPGKTALDAGLQREDRSAVRCRALSLEWGVPAQRRGGRRHPLSWGSGVVLSVVAAAAAPATDVSFILDRTGDAVIRRIDSGADGSVDPASHHQPDIVAVRICRWQPSVPHQDLFTGAAAASGDFFRLDIIFDGLVNPPGPNGCCSLPFAPFQYGPHPVSGYVEIDVDPGANSVTGGELDLPQLMFLGNAARFGGLPADSFLQSRCARDASAFDSNVTTPPLVDRSGEDFHIALHGWEITEVHRTVGTNMLFGPGDVWLVRGRLFPRARGYERFSFADTNGQPGRYSPIVRLRFAHNVSEDQTTISLVYPLNNQGSAAQANTGIVQPLDGDAANQNSVLEALDDLVFSSSNASSLWRADPAFVLVAPWELLAPAPAANSAAQFLHPLSWRITVLVGGSYTAPGNDGQFVWSDVLPDVRPGDFNGDGSVDWRDRLALHRFIADHDGMAGSDSDGDVNCSVGVPNFGPNFSVFDVNYDGVVDDGDVPMLSSSSRVPGDIDGDSDVDLVDFGALQSCLGVVLSASSHCTNADLDLDRQVDGRDLAVMRMCASRAAVPADYSRTAGVGCVRGRGLWGMGT
jgi:hypothetical protein